jgi:hypothetical protein
MIIGVIMNDVEGAGYIVFPRHSRLDRESINNIAVTLLSVVDPRVREDDGYSDE